MAPGAVHALLVGIDAYEPPVAPLLGCVPDLEAFERLLRLRLDDRPLHLVTLRDREATRAAVVAGFRDHLAKAGPDDVALFHYSGHGSQEDAPPELWAGEPDHRNETLVLADSRAPGGWDLADKELAVLLREVGERAGHVLVVLDSCHAGSGTRGAGADVVRVRWAAADHRARPVESYLVGTDGRSAVVPPAPGSGWPVAGRHVLLAACRDDQTAKECRGPRALGGGVRGALSIALERALQGEGAGLTYRELHRWVAADVRTRVPDQEPQLETATSADLDRPFLGGAVRRVPATFTATHDRDRGWVLDGGAVHGLVAPRGQEQTCLVVLDPAKDATARSVEDVLANATVTAVTPGSATVSVTPATALDEARSYPALVVASPLPRVPIHLAGDATVVTALRTALGDPTSSMVTVENEADAQLLATAKGGVVRVVRPAATAELAVAVRVDHGIGRVVAVLGQIARWLLLAGLRNATTALAPDTVRVDLVGPSAAGLHAGRLTVSYADDGPPLVEVGMTNTSPEPVWCALLDLTETYGVFADAFPAGSVCLQPGEKVATSLRAELPDGLWERGARQLSDVLKVVVSTEPLDARLLAQPELDLDNAVPADVVRKATVPATTLDRLMARVVTRRVPSRPEAGERLADWTASELTVTVSRPEA